MKWPKVHCGEASTLGGIPPMILFQHLWLVVNVPENLPGLRSWKISSLVQGLGLQFSHAIPQSISDRPP